MKIRVTDVIIRVDGMSFEITGAHDAEVLLLENPFSKGQTLSVRVAKGEMNTLRGAVSEGLADLDAGRREKFTAEKIKAEGRAMLRAGGFPVSEGEASSSSMTGDCVAGVATESARPTTWTFRDTVFYDAEVLVKFLMHNVNNRIRLEEELVFETHGEKGRRLTGHQFLVEWQSDEKRRREWEKSRKLEKEAEARRTSAMAGAITGATGIAVGSGPGDLRSVPDGFVLTTRGLMTEDEFLNLLRAKH
jgi:hypothetical protein